MKNKYNLKEIYELIINGETLIQTEILNSGEEAWPIVRMVFWNVLSNSTVTSNKNSLKNTALNSRKILQKL